MNPDVHLLRGTRESFGDILDSSQNRESYNARRALKKSKLVERVENDGSDVIYRFVYCRDCSDCKKNEQIQCISIQEEIEQDIIDSSVQVHIGKGVTTARLPFLENPLIKLNPNRKFDRKSNVMESERKIQKLGFVDKLENRKKRKK